MYQEYLTSTGVCVMTNFTTYIMLYTKQYVQLDSIPNTTSSQLTLVFPILCHKNENVYAFNVFCDYLSFH